MGPKHRLKQCGLGMSLLVNWKFLINYEPRRNPDAKELRFFGERRLVTLYKQNRMRNSTELQLLEENTEIDTEIDVPVSKEQNLAQRLNSKHKSFPIRCTEKIEQRGWNFSRHKVGFFLYVLNMMLDGSTRRLGPMQDYGKIRERTLLDISPPRSVNVDHEMCSRANLRKLARDIIDLH